jgi:hypothetical protein
VVYVGSPILDKTRVWHMQYHCYIQRIRTMPTTCVLAGPPQRWHPQICQDSNLPTRSRFLQCRMPSPWGRMHHSTSYQTPHSLRQQLRGRIRNASLNGTPNHQALPFRAAPLGRLCKIWCLGDKLVDKIVMGEGLKI